MRYEGLRPCLRLFSPCLNIHNVGRSRWLHGKKKQLKPPAPIPFVPDVQSFLTLIGRGLSRHASKFPSWESLFALTGPEIQKLGIEPARTRRYLLSWIQRYRAGNFGPGGDFRYVKDGEARLKIARPPCQMFFESKWVVNVPPEGVKMPAKLSRPAGYTVHGIQSISGPRALPLPGGGAVVKITEGMWEDRLGRKVDGGERRMAMIRTKKRSAERRAQREAELAESSG